MSRNLSFANGTLNGEVALPGDKSITHRAILFGLLAKSRCTATGWQKGADTLSSLAAVQELGAQVSEQGDVLTIVPAADDVFTSWPVDPKIIDCGNSGTTCRLLAGLLAGWLPAGISGVILTGDESLSKRPMGRVVEPLLAMGANITWLEKNGQLPMLIQGATLTAGSHTLPVPSAQIKSALLLAGLAAEGTTSISGSAASRDHTERLLQTMGIDVQLSATGQTISVKGPVIPGPFEVEIPADPSAAAFLQVAAALVPGSCVTITGQSLNTGRIGALTVFEQAGVCLDIVDQTEDRFSEPSGDVTVSYGSLNAFSLASADIPGLIDELPVLAVLATQATGETLITGAAELRVKESDRISLMARGLKELGADIEELPDGWRISGPAKLRGGSQDNPIVHQTGSDHRIAMALAVAALVTAGETALDDYDCVAVSFPDFFEVLKSLHSV